MNIKDQIELSILRAYKGCIEQVLAAEQVPPCPSIESQIENITNTTNLLLKGVNNDKPRNESQGTDVPKEPTGK